MGGGVEEYKSPQVVVWAVGWEPDRVLGLWYGLEEWQAIDIEEKEIQLFKENIIQGSHKSCNSSCFYQAETEEFTGDWILRWISVQ